MCQAYVTVRYLLTQRKHPLPRGRKWLLIARMLDALEADFRQVYPDSPPPFDEGFEQALRILINELD